MSTHDVTLTAEASSLAHQAVFGLIQALTEAIASFPAAHPLGDVDSHDQSPGVVVPGHLTGHLYAAVIDFARESGTFYSADDARSRFYAALAEHLEPYRSGPFVDGHPDDPRIAWEVLNGAALDVLGIVSPVMTAVATALLAEFEVQVHSPVLDPHPLAPADGLLTHDSTQRSARELCAVFGLPTDEILAASSGEGQRLLDRYLMATYYAHTGYAHTARVRIDGE